MQPAVAMDTGSFDICPRLEAHFRILGHQRPPMETEHELAELEHTPGQHWAAVRPWHAASALTQEGPVSGTRAP